MISQRNIFEFVYTMALRDATLQKAYEGKKQHFFDNETAKKTVEDYAQKVLGGQMSTQEIADQETEKAIQQLVKDFSDEGFTFGNAQKLLNMTMKYLYISAYGDTAKEQDYRDRFQFCHCPMDSQMIKYVLRRRTEKEVAAILGENTRALYDDTRWSKLADKSDVAPHNSTAAYYDYQRIIRALSTKEECIPIEFDFAYFS